MKNQTAPVTVKSTGGVIVKEISVEVGQFVDVRLNEEELIALDDVTVLHGPGRFQLENRGEAGITVQVEKGR